MIMEQVLNFNYILDTMANNYGLAGIFANCGFGTTTLMMQIVDEINKRKDGTAIIMSNELSDKHWIEWMKRMDLSTERVVVCDKSTITHCDIYDTLVKTQDIEKKNVSIVCVDCIDMMEIESISKLREIADRLKVLVLVNGKLCRDSGDYAHDLRPEMYSIGVFRNHMHGNGNQVYPTREGQPCRHLLLLHQWRVVGKEYAYLRILLRLLQQPQRSSRA